MRKIFAAAVFVLSLTLGTLAGTAQADTYTAHVVAKTSHYGPCKRLMRNTDGRALYRDLVTDSYDDDAAGNLVRRTVKDQVRYVRQGCRNGV